MERRYADMTSMEAFPTSSVYPTKVGQMAVEIFSIVGVSI